MDISVIIPIYKVEKYIVRCLSSLFEQSKTENVEFILINDCTPDNSMQLARELIKNYPLLDIKIIEHKKNLHVSAARQTGLNTAQGNFIIQIDSDDWCEKTMLEDLYAQAIRDNADIVVCDYYQHDNSIIKCPQQTDAIECLDMILNHSYPSMLWNKLVARRLFTDNDISFDNTINFGEDFLMCLKLYSKSPRISYCQRALIHYTQNQDSITSQYELYFDDHLARIEKTPQILDSKSTNRQLAATLKYFKLKEKNHILKSTRGSKQKRASKLFPEMRRHCFRVKNITFASRLALFFASHGMLNLANIIYFTASNISLKKHEYSHLYSLPTYWWH